MTLQQRLIHEAASTACALNAATENGAMREAVVLYVSEEDRARITAGLSQRALARCCFVPQTCGTTWGQA